MKKFITLLFMATFASCNGQTGADITKTVRAADPNMNNMEILSMTQLPGWSLLTGTQWVGISYTNCFKGVNDKLNASFFSENTRGYVQDQFHRSGTTDGKTVYLNVMSAADYLDYVFRHQFPNLKGAKRTTLKTLDQFSEAERKQLEEQRVTNYNNAIAYSGTLPNGQNIHIRNQYIDRSCAEYKWTDKNGDSIVHAMDVILNATQQDFLSRDLNTTMILWNQGALFTVTSTVKNVGKAVQEADKMLQTIKFNEQYMTACNNIVKQGIAYNDAQTRRIMNEMAVSEMQHRQKMASMMQETNDYIANARREVNANRQASMERINNGWRDAIVGVDRFVGTDGKVLEVPTSAGHNVWQSAEGGTVYSSDSYIFNPVAGLPDKDGVVREFRQLQLLK